MFRLIQPSDLSFSVRSKRKTEKNGRGGGDSPDPCLSWKWLEGRDPWLRRYKTYRNMLITCSTMIALQLHCSVHRNYYHIPKSTTSINAVALVVCLGKLSVCSPIGCAACLAPSRACELQLWSTLQHAKAAILRPVRGVFFRDETSAVFPLSSTPVSYRASNRVVEYFPHGQNV